VIAVRDRRFYRDQPRTDTLVQNQFGLAGLVKNDSVPTLRLFAKQQAFEHGLKASDEFSIPLCCRSHHRELHRHGNESK
jgi:hypothetical protein